MRTNREYKRGKPFRDAIKIVIITEGEKTEKTYFQQLNRIFKSRRFIIQTFTPDQHKSAPKYAEDRIRQIIKHQKLKSTDKIWLVFDVDNWDEHFLSGLYNKKLIEKVPVTLLLSNPCFEVWLWAHYFPIREIQSETCKKLKKELHDKLQTGFDAKNITKKHVEYAAAQCKKHCQGGWIPKLNNSKIFELIDFLQNLDKQSHQLH